MFPCARLRGGLIAKLNRSARARSWNEADNSYIGSLYGMHWLPLYFKAIAITGIRSIAEG